MQIDWTHFTPASALAGGALNGLSASSLLLLSGCIAGVSSILAGLIPPKPDDAGWRVAFLAGLSAAPLAAGPFGERVTPVFAPHYGWLVLAGLLVGLGARLGGGCTSGHGVGRLSRLSIRSLVATATFMASAMTTVFVYFHLWATR